jgi:hypothetical protein
MTAKLQETEKALRNYASQYGWPSLSEWNRYAKENGYLGSKVYTTTPVKAGKTTEKPWALSHAENASQEKNASKLSNKPLVSSASFSQKSNIRNGKNKTPLSLQQ